MPAVLKRLITSAKIKGLSSVASLCFGLLCLSYSAHAATLEWDFSQASDYAVAGTATISGNLAQGTVTSALSPQEIGAWENPNFSGTVRDVVIRGHYAYLARGYIGLQIVDISNPASPS